MALLRKNNLLLYILILSNYPLHGRGTNEFNDKRNFAIHSAIQYINSRILEENIAYQDDSNSKSLTYSNRLIYNYLQIEYPNYFRNDTFNVLTNYKPYYDDDTSIFPLFNRWIYKNMVVDTIRVYTYLSNYKDISQAMCWGLYADFSDNYISEINITLEKYASSEEYSDFTMRQVAHCALVLFWAKQINMDAKISRYSVLKGKYMMLARTYLQNNPIWTDTGMEAMLTLFLLEFPYHLKNKWLKELINHQMPDGGWKYDLYSENTHQHPSVLALWILLWSNTTN